MTSTGSWTSTYSDESSMISPECGNRVPHRRPGRVSTLQFEPGLSESFFWKF